MLSCIANLHLEADVLLQGIQVHRALSVSTHKQTGKRLLFGTRKTCVTRREAGSRGDPSVFARRQAKGRESGDSQGTVADHLQITGNTPTHLQVGKCHNHIQHNSPEHTDTLDTVYVEYFTKAIIELVKVNEFLILRINLDS